MVTAAFNIGANARSEAAISIVAGRAAPREGPHQARAGETRAAAPARARTADKRRWRSSGRSRENKNKRSCYYIASCIYYKSHPLLVGL